MGKYFYITHKLSLATYCQPSLSSQHIIVTTSNQIHHSCLPSLALHLSLVFFLLSSHFTHLPHSLFPSLALHPSLTILSPFLTHIIHLHHSFLPSLALHPSFLILSPSLSHFLLHPLPLPYSLSLYSQTCPLTHLPHRTIRVGEGGELGGD